MNWEKDKKGDIGPWILLLILILVLVFFILKGLNIF